MWYNYVELPQADSMANLLLKHKLTYRVSKCYIIQPHF